MRSDHLVSGPVVDMMAGWLQFVSVVCFHVTHFWRGEGRLASKFFPPPALRSVSGQGDDVRLELKGSRRLANQNATLLELLHTGWEWHHMSRPCLVLP